MPSRVNCSSSAIPTPPDWTARPARPGRRGAGGERGVQAYAGYREAEAVRADQPHSVVAAAAQQGGPAAVIQSRGDHHERPDSPLAAFLGDLQDCRRGHGHHRDVNRFGQLGCRRQARHALKLAGMRVDPVHAPGVAAGDDVAQDGPADRLRPPAGSHYGHRFRSENMAQARHVGVALPLGHRVQIGLPGGIASPPGRSKASSVTPSTSLRRAVSPASANTFSIAEFSARTRQ